MNNNKTLSRKIINLRTEKNYKKALITCRLLFKKCSHEPWPHIILTKTLTDARKYTKAKAAFDKFVSSFPNDKRIPKIKTYIDDNIKSLYLEVEKIILTTNLLELKDSEKYHSLCDGLIDLESYKKALELSRHLSTNLKDNNEFLALVDYLSQYVEPNFSTPLTLEGDSSFYELHPRSFLIYSRNKNFFHELQHKRPLAPIDDYKLDGKTFLSIAGLGRSGTTALGQLLNISPDIELYTELYRCYDLKGYIPSQFCKNRLKHNLKKHAHAAKDVKTFEKNDSSKFVGDKRPYFQFSAESTYDNFLGIEKKFIYILRPLAQICLSSLKRSLDPVDTWSAEKNIIYTVLLYNASCRQMIHLHNSRTEIFNTFFYVHYENIFTDVNVGLNLFQTIGASIDGYEKKIEAFIASSAEKVRNSSSAAKQNSTIEDIIDKYLDKDVHTAFLEAMETNTIRR
jgi:tetratricopeptide (TPR) repeat protein